MRIAVVIRQVPDTEADIVIHPDDATRIREDEIKWIMNPYDEYAVEAAVSIAEDHGGETLAVCVGPERSESAVRTAMAMGIDEGLLVIHPAGFASDIMSEARIVAAALRDKQPLLILCGREFIDTGDDAMAAALAEHLNLPHVLNAGKVEFSKTHIMAERDVDGAILKIRLELPGVISCQKGLNEPRYPNLMAVRRAQKKPLETLTLQGLGLDTYPALTRCRTLLSPPSRTTGKRISGDPGDTARQAVQWLTDEARVL